MTMMEEDSTEPAPSSSSSPKNNSPPSPPRLTRLKRQKGTLSGISKPNRHRPSYAIRPSSFTSSKDPFQQRTLLKGTSQINRTEKQLYDHISYNTDATSKPSRRVQKSYLDIVPDQNTWIEKPFRNLKNGEMVVMFVNSSDGRKVEEPPSGASHVLYMRNSVRTRIEREGVVYKQSSTLDMDPTIREQEMEDIIEKCEEDEFSNDDGNEEYPEDEGKVFPGNSGMIGEKEVYNSTEDGSNASESQRKEQGHLNISPKSTKSHGSSHGSSSSHYSSPKSTSSSSHYASPKSTSSSSPRSPSSPSDTETSQSKPTPQDTTKVSSSVTAPKARTHLSRQKNFRVKTRRMARSSFTKVSPNETTTEGDNHKESSEASEVWVERIFRNKKTGHNQIYYVSSTTRKRYKDAPPEHAKRIVYLTSSFRRLHVREKRKDVDQSGEVGGSSRDSKDESKAKSDETIKVDTASSSSSSAVPKATSTSPVESNVLSETTATATKAGAHSTSSGDETDAWIAFSNNTNEFSPDREAMKKQLSNTQYSDGLSNGRETGQDQSQNLFPSSPIAALEEKYNGKIDETPSRTSKASTSVDHEDGMSENSELRLSALFPSSPVAAIEKSLKDSVDLNTSNVSNHDEKQETHTSRSKEHIDMNESTTSYGTLSSLPQQHTSTRSLDSTSFFPATSPNGTRRPKPPTMEKTKNFRVSQEVWVEKIFKSKKKGNAKIFFVSTQTNERREQPPPSAERVLYLTKSCRRMFHQREKRNHDVDVM